MEDSPFKPHFFEREDESPDPYFYAQARMLVHIDDHAIEAASRLYAELLPQRGAILDLMSSFKSHMPPELEWKRLCGLGMNDEELRANDKLTEYLVHDLNKKPAMPFGDDEFDGAVVTVSVQYMTKPLEIFREVCRVLKPGAPFIVTYSNRKAGSAKGTRRRRVSNCRYNAKRSGWLKNPWRIRMPKTTVSRSAKSGQFVTEKFAKGHPSTTVKETVKKAPPKSR